MACPHFTSHQEIFTPIRNNSKKPLAIRKNLQYTRQKQPHKLPVIPETGFPSNVQIVLPRTEQIAEDTKPVEEVVKENSDIFCFAAQANKQKGAIYTDLTGRFSIPSFKDLPFYHVLL